MQPSATSAGVDLGAAAQACRLHVEADDQKRIIPSRDGPATKYRFMQAMGRRT